MRTSTKFLNNDPFKSNVLSTAEPQTYQIKTFKAECRLLETFDSRHSKKSLEETAETCKNPIFLNSSCQDRPRPNLVNRRGPKNPKPSEFQASHLFDLTSMPALPLNPYTSARDSKLKGREMVFLFYGSRGLGHLELMGLYYRVQWREGKMS